MKAQYLPEVSEDAPMSIIGAGGQCRGGVYPRQRGGRKARHYVIRCFYSDLSAVSIAQKEDDRPFRKDPSGEARSDCYREFLGQCTSGVPAWVCIRFQHWQGVFEIMTGGGQ